MLGLYRCVGCYNISLQYPMFLHVDNSDSPSIVEQSQQGHDFSCYALLADIPSSVKYPIPYACQVASCNVGISCCIFLSLVGLLSERPIVMHTVKWEKCQILWTGPFCGMNPPQCWHLMEILEALWVWLLSHVIPVLPLVSVHCCKFWESFWIVFGIETGRNSCILCILAFLAVKEVVTV